MVNLYASYQLTDFSFDATQHNHIAIGNERKRAVQAFVSLLDVLDGHVSAAVRTHRHLQHTALFLFQSNDHKTHLCFCVVVNVRVFN